MNRAKWTQTIKKIFQFLMNPRLLLCIAVAWIITNGWSYVLMTLGTWLQSGWMMAVAGAYLTFLWLPVSPEKIATFAIAIALLRWWFPHDVKTLAVLKELRQKAQDAFQRRKDRKKAPPEKPEAPLL